MTNDRIVVEATRRNKTVTLMTLNSDDHQSYDDRYSDDNDGVDVGDDDYRSYDDEQQLEEEEEAESEEEE